MPAKPSQDLGLAIPDRWTVQTAYHHQTKKDREAKLPLEEKHHELLFGGCCIEKDTGERGKKRLNEMATLFNRTKVIPRDRAIQCLADDSGSIETRLKKQCKRAFDLGFTKTIPVGKQSQRATAPPPPANVVRFIFPTSIAA